MLQAAYADAPATAKDWIDGKAMEILMVDMPALQHCLKQGPVMDVEKATGVVDTFTKSMELGDSVNPEAGKKLSQTVRDVGLRIAEEIDSGMKRVLLEDTKLSRISYIHLCTQHAKLVKALAEVALTPEELEEWEEYQREPNS
jgi:hypothetical protein